MSTAAVVTLSEVEAFRNIAGTTQKIVLMNVEGVSQAESLVQPQPAGNCLNWILGHLVCVYNNLLPLVKQTPIVNRDDLKRYDRGTPPLNTPAEATDIGELINLWNKTADRFDAGLASLTPEDLDEKATVSPRNDPNETVRSLLSLITFHQAYHAGQLGVLRRIAGKPGAIA